MDYVYIMRMFIRVFDRFIFVIGFILLLIEIWRYCNFVMFSSEKCFCINVFGYFGLLMFEC